MQSHEFVYRLIEPENWNKAKVKMTLPYAEIDQRDGFLHLSTFEQMLATAERYYGHVEELIALEIPLAAITEMVRFEKASNGEAFPHLYGELPISIVKRTLSLVKNAEGAFVAEMAVK